MKRLLLTTFVAIVCSIGFAQKVTIDGITYKVKDGEAYVLDADKNLEHAVIKESVIIDGKNYPVTKIGLDRAITIIRQFAEHKKLKYVSIPNSIQYIMGSSFSNCRNLKEVYVPDHPIVIEGLKKSNGQMSGNSSFYECNAITTVKCQNGSFPTYILGKIPDACPFMMTAKYQQPFNNQQVAYTQNTTQQPIQVAPKEEKKTPSSDVDVNLPTNAANNENTFVVIFANENYQDVDKVEYALNDGEMMSQYCQKVLGVPERNIRFHKDATRNDMIGEIVWMKGVAEAYEGNARFIVYYVGHGIPDEKSGSSYLLPIDGRKSILETGYSLRQFYAQLSEMPSTSVIVFLDACFSGSKRGEGMLVSARGVGIKAKPEAPKGKMVVFSAAQGDETAYPYSEKEHGLFTYYLLKKLKDTSGSCTLGELNDYVTSQVKRLSIVVNSKSQTPTATPSPALVNSWKTMKLK